MSDVLYSVPVVFADYSSADWYLACSALSGAFFLFGLGFGIGLDLFTSWLVRCLPKRKHSRNHKEPPTSAS